MRRSLVRGATSALAVVALTLVLSAPVGATVGPSLVRDINPRGDASPSELTRVGSTVYFAANDGLHGRELWKTDGTAAGTRMVKNIRPYGKSASPQYLTNVDGTLFFTANDGAHKRQLWKSDGTSAGTVRVTNIVAGDEPHGLFVPIPPVAVGSRLFFFNEECCVGTATLYVTDGAATGTRAVAYLEEAPGEGQTLAYKGKLNFVAEQGAVGDEFRSQELWTTDGTWNGTHRIPGTPVAESITILPASGANLYFATENYWPGRVWQFRLWKTDGTKPGTKPLTSVGELPGLGGEAAYLSKRIYFDVDWSSELWRTDGTALGTVPVAAFNGVLNELTTLQNRLFFTVEEHLWRTNGTAVGTFDVHGFGPGLPWELIAVGHYLCIAVMNWDDGTWTLWVSDGTASGTHSVGTYDGVPSGLALTAMGGKLLFAADDGAHGVELWSYTP